LLNGFGDGDVDRRVHQHWAITGEYVLRHASLVPSNGVVGYIALAEVSDCGHILSGVKDSRLVWRHTYCGLGIHVRPACMMGWMNVDR